MVFYKVLPLLRLHYFSISGIIFWKRQTVEKRRIEIAEKILMAFYKARDVVQFSRQNRIFVGEHKLVESTFQNTSMDMDKHALNCLIVVERLNREDDIFSELQSLYYSYTVILGGSPVTFQKFSEIISKISMAALQVGKLWRDAEKKSIAADDKIKIKQFESIIWATGDDNDIISKELRDITIEVENICSKHIAINQFSAPQDISFAANRLRLKIIGRR
ncbi:MAG: hypothetical protein AB7D37_04310 [Desulfovibrio sp.]